MTEHGCGGCWSSNCAAGSTSCRPARPIDQAAALRVLLVEARLGADRPIELALRVPGTAEGFVHKSGMVHHSGLRTNPVRVAFPVTTHRRAGKILVEPGAPQG
jgi:hypothetical protein